jgi:L,D-transpeptidase ErfK/SrfK
MRHPLRLFATTTLALVAVVAAGRAQAATTPKPPASADERLASLPPVVGQLESELISDPEDTVLDVAYRHRLGFDRIARLNPDVNVWIPDPGAVIRLPTEHVLPDVARRGLVVNVPEMQLYDFTQDERERGERAREGRSPNVEIFAIAIGDSIDPSLVGEFKVGRKRENPAWHVPKSIQAERPELPPVVPPGPDNPLGPFWMTIGNTSYGIHGSNNEWSIGREATHGCIRLYNDQIELLWKRTKPGTPLRLIYQSVKVGQRDRTIFVEAHPDVYGRDPEREVAAVERLRRLDLWQYVDEAAFRRAIGDAVGIPIPVGTLPTETAPLLVN